MRPTSSKGPMRNSRGMTLMEVSVALVVLMLLVALIVPVMPGMIRTANERAFRTRLEDTVAAARAMARSGQGAVAVRLSSARGPIEVVRYPTASTGGAIDPVTLQRVRIPDGLNVVRAYIDDQETPVDDWMVSFTPFGLSRHSRLCFGVGDSPEWTLVTTADGDSYTVNGLPAAIEAADVWWSAGELAPRAEITTP